MPMLILLDVSDVSPAERMGICCTREIKYIASSSSVMAFCGKALRYMLVGAVESSMGATDLNFSNTIRASRYFVHFRLTLLREIWLANSVLMVMEARFYEK